MVAGLVGRLQVQIEIRVYHAKVEINDVVIN
jgi:hypothetical protein